jgi:hypothetical protein
VTSAWATPSAPAFDETPGEVWYRAVWCTKVKRTIQEVVEALRELLGDRADYSDVTDNPFQIETITLCCLLGGNWQTVQMGSWEPDPSDLQDFPSWLLEAK